jgi:hypothetical protein
MENVYKNSLGVWTNKQSDKHDYTHIIMSNAEYRDLMDKISSQAYTIQQTQDNCEQQIASMKRRYNQWMQQTKAELSDQITAAEADAEKYKDLNANLLRICKERANASRGLHPKKTHPGYVIKSSRQAIRVDYDGRRRKETEVWRTLVETPYTINLASNHVLDNIDINCLKFTGTYYNDYRLIKDYKAKLWDFEIDTINEITDIA